MHDKQVRRRRAVLGLLVVVSLILLTAYFGESPGSPLHSIQRGIVAVLSPVQEGASKVLSPFRDVAGLVLGHVPREVGGQPAQGRRGGAADAATHRLK